MIPHLSERALILAPQGRDASVAAEMLSDARLRSHTVVDLTELVMELQVGAGFAVVTEEALAGGPLHRLSEWIEDARAVVAIERGVPAATAPGNSPLTISRS